jgi:hypothetical protein
MHTVAERLSFRPMKRQARAVKRPPTDLDILELVYKRYYAVYAEGAGRSSKMYVPIDVADVAARLGVDADIIFGRLYYHLEQKHAYRKADGSLVSFFTPRAGGDADCVNFPLMASVLATLQDEERRYLLPTSIAFVSLIVSVAAITAGFR